MPSRAHKSYRFKAPNARGHGVEWVSDRVQRLSGRLSAVVSATPRRGRGGVLAAFVAVPHCGDQVLAAAHHPQHDAGHVRDDQRQCEVRQRLVVGEPSAERAVSLGAVTTTPDAVVRSRLASKATIMRGWRRRRLRLAGGDGRRLTLNLARRNSVREVEQLFDANRKTLANAGQTVATEPALADAAYWRPDPGVLHVRADGCYLTLHLAPAQDAKRDVLRSLASATLGRACAHPGS